MPTYPQGAVDVTTAESLEQAVRTLSDSPSVAVDVEADALHAFLPKLCFIQVATQHDVFLFDTLIPEVQPQRLAPLFADSVRTKFFHAASGDLQYLAENGIRVKGLFDTHRAATLLGWQRVGLADLARQLLGVELPKEHQQSDFSLRPLPPAMRHYIADDVRYLCEIGNQVRDACRKADILEEVELDCQRLADEAASRPEIGADFKPKFAPTVSPHDRAFALALAYALHEKRLQWAREADLPFGRILSNAAVSALSSRPPSDFRELVKTPYLRGPIARERGQEILSLIQAQRAQSAKGEVPPGAQKKPPRDPARRKREEALREFRARKAAERKVVPSVVLSNSLLSDLSENPPRSLEELARAPYFGEKRLRLYGAELIQLLTQVR